MILSKSNKKIDNIIKGFLPAYKEINNPLIITDETGKIIFYNNSALKILGNELEIGEKIHSCLQTGGKNQMEEYFAKASGTGESITFVYKLKNKIAGKVKIILNPVKEGNKQPIGYVFLIKPLNFETKAGQFSGAVLHALTNVSELVIITDINKKLIFANKSAESKLGYTQEELLNKNLKELTGNKLFDELNRAEDFTGGDKIWEGESFLITKSGRTFPAKISISNIFNSNNPANNLLLLTATDISLQKETERKLYESERKFRSLFENATLGMYRSDRNGNIIIANPQLLHILGYDSIEDLNAGGGYVDPTVKEKLREILETEGTIYGFETAWQRPDGKIIYIRESLKAFWDENGLLSYYEGTVEDITDKIIAEVEVQKHAKILSALKSISEILLRPINWSSQLNEVCSVLGKTLKIDRVRIFQHLKNDDERGKFIFIKKAEWNRNKNINEIKESVDFKRIGLQNWVEKLMRNEIVRKDIDSANAAEKSFLIKNNIASILIVPIFVNNEFWGGIGMHDFSNVREWTNSEVEALLTAAESISASIQRLNYEERLIEALNESEKSVRLKSEFLAQISHEIRTPINNILNFISLIKLQLGSNLDEDLQTSFKIIQRSSDRLIRTIDLILNMSELQTGSYKPNKVMFDIFSEILEKIYLENKYKAKELNIEFKLVKETDETFIYADKYSVEQIFINLLDNAFKFTKEGKIEINIQRQNEQLIVKVIDTGIGISEEFLPDLFHPFRQEEQGYTRSFEGSGLGLSLVKEYCDLNNAVISVESRKGGGTVFEIKFSSAKT